MALAEQRTTPASHHARSGVRMSKTGRRFTPIALVATALALGAPLAATAGGLHAHGSSDPWATPDARDRGVRRMPQFGGPPPGMMAPPPGMVAPHPGVMAGPQGEPVLPAGHYDPTAVRDGRVVQAAAQRMQPDFGPANGNRWTDRVWAARAAARTYVASKLRGQYFRTDFLLYEIEDVGTQPLGVPINGIDISQPFEIANSPGPGLPAVVIGNGIVPTTEDVFFKDIYGARLTWGIPLVNDVTLEVAAFATQQADHQRFLLPGPLPNDVQATLLVNTTLANGLPSTNVQIYDSDYTLDFTSRIGGFGGRLLLPATDRGFVSIRPTVGWRYFQVHETVVQRGQFTQTGGGIQNSILRSDVYNNITGVELGFQTEVKWRFLTFGVEPALTLGPNKYKARTTTDQFVATTDPLRVQEIDDLTISPTLMVGGYAKARIRDNVELRIGYDAMWFSRVQRPVDAIVFDIADPENTSLVRPEKDLTNIFVDGLNASVVIYLGNDTSSQANRRRQLAIVEPQPVREPAFIDEAGLIGSHLECGWGPTTEAPRGSQYWGPPLSELSHTQITSKWGVLVVARHGRTRSP